MNLILCKFINKFYTSCLYVIRLQLTTFTILYVLLIRPAFTIQVTGIKRWNFYADMRLVIQVTGIKRWNFYADMRLGFEDILLLIRFYCNLLDKIFELKIQRVHGILNYLCPTDQSKAFLNWLCQYIFSRCFFSIYFSLWKSVGLSHIAYIMIR